MSFFASNLPWHKPARQIRGAQWWITTGGHGRSVSALARCISACLVSRKSFVRGVRLQDMRSYQVACKCASLFLSQMLHVWYIYLQNWVIYGVNVGPAPWFAYGCVSSPRLRRCKRKKQITTRCGAVVPVPPASGRQKAFVSWVSFFQFTTVFPGISPEFNFVIFYKYIFCSEFSNSASQFTVQLFVSKCSVWIEYHHLRTQNLSAGSGWNSGSNHASLDPGCWECM